MPVDPGTLRYDAVSIDELSHAVLVLAANLFGRLELHEATQSVSGELAEQAACVRERWD